MTATLRLRTEALVKYRRIAGLDTNDSLAKKMQINAGNLSRVLGGRQTPGPKFMAALVAAFPGLELDDLFEVVVTSEEAA